MTRARTVVLFVVALALLGLGWSSAPRFAPPIYDGVGFPDEPYRFVVQPAGAAATRPPTTATGAAAVNGGTVGAVHASSAENAPQASVLVPIGRLRATSGARRVVLHAAPVGPVPAPSGGYLWSNVYDVSATGSVALRNGSPAATITLRAATAQRPVPMIERYGEGAWTRLETHPVGSDIYVATLPSLGRYAVIGSEPLNVARLKAGGAKAPASQTGKIVAGVAVVVVIGLVVIGIRRRSKARAAEETLD